MHSVKTQKRVLVRSPHFHEEISVVTCNNFQNSSEHLIAIGEHTTTFWNFLVYTFSNVVECTGIVWNIPKYSRAFHTSSQTNCEIFLKIPERSKSYNIKFIKCIYIFFQTNGTYILLYSYFSILTYFANTTSAFV